MKRYTVQGRKKHKPGLQVRNCSPCGERSPYWDWVYKYGTQVDGTWVEPFGANMDLIGETVVPDTENIQIAKEMLRDGSLHVLSKRESQVFYWIVTKGLTLQETARKMGIKWNSCESYFKRMRVKLRKVCLENYPDRRLIMERSTDHA